MTKEQVRRVLNRVAQWPMDRQADLAEIALIMEAQDKSDLGLSEDQAKEVQRRLSDTTAKTIGLAEFGERLRRRYGI